MTNEAVVWVLIITIFSFSLWLSSGIYLILKRLNHSQELVRCKDCKHYRYYGLSEETVSECRIDHAENPDGNWYCADGERREDDD